MAKILTRQVISPSGQRLWLEFESGYIDNKGAWRVISTEPQEFEEGNIILPDVLEGEGWKILQEDEEDLEDPVFVFYDEETGKTINPMDAAGNDPVLRAMVRSTDEILRELMEDPDDAD